MRVLSFASYEPSPRPAVTTTKSWISSPKRSAKLDFIKIGRGARAFGWACFTNFFRILGGVF
jgi:hypothetical protein